MSFKPLYVTPTGIAKYWRDNGDGTSSVLSAQDVGSIIERNKAMANHNDGYTGSREMRRVASIPLVLIEKWKREEGWDALDPDHSDKLMQKLNDPDYAFLRTAEGRLGMTQDGTFR